MVKLMISEKGGCEEDVTSRGSSRGARDSDNCVFSRIYLKCRYIYTCVIRSELIHGRETWARRKPERR